MVYAQPASVHRRPIGSLLGGVSCRLSIYLFAAVLLHLAVVGTVLSLVLDVRDVEIIIVASLRLLVAREYAGVLRGVLSDVLRRLVHHAVRHVHHWLWVLIALMELTSKLRHHSRRRVVEGRPLVFKHLTLLFLLRLISHTNHSLVLYLCVMSVIDLLLLSCQMLHILLTLIHKLRILSCLVRRALVGLLRSPARVGGRVRLRARHWKTILRNILYQVWVLTLHLELLKLELFLDFHLLLLLWRKVVSAVQNLCVLVGVVCSWWSCLAVTHTWLLSDIFRVWVLPAEEPSLSLTLSVLFDHLSLFRSWALALGEMWHHVLETGCRWLLYMTELWLLVHLLFVVQRLLHFLLLASKNRMLALDNTALTRLVLLCPCVLSHESVRLADKTLTHKTCLIGQFGGWNIHRISHGSRVSLPHCKLPLLLILNRIGSLNYDVLLCLPNSWITYRWIIVWLNYRIRHTLMILVRISIYRIPIWSWHLFKLCALTCSHLFVMLWVLFRWLTR